MILNLQGHLIPVHHSKRSRNKMKCKEVLKVKIFDMHIHLGYTKPMADIIERMTEAGVYGGCVFSTPPKEAKDICYKDFDERLEEVLSLTAPHKDRLFPILWIHPYEENIMKKIDIAVEKGIDGFKIICNDFYVYDEKCLEILQKIADLGKPVFFHSGILWDGNVSSEYNRPLNWEALLRIKGLKFSMGHCSWPWHDECIALYGKFLHSCLHGDTAEMFLDLTPGTPEIYREDLIKKLFLSGYDTERNILFGTDCSAEDYKSELAKKWLRIDGELMDKFGVSDSARKNIYHNNLMYFLGKFQGEKPKKVFKIPTPDNPSIFD